MLGYGVSWKFSVFQSSSYWKFPFTTCTGIGAFSMSSYPVAFEPASPKTRLPPVPLVMIPTTYGFPVSGSTGNFGKSPKSQSYPRHAHTVTGEVELAYDSGFNLDALGVLPMVASFDMTRPMADKSFSLTALLASWEYPPMLTNPTVARMANIVITTMSSTSVNPLFFHIFPRIRCEIFRIL